MAQTERPTTPQHQNQPAMTFVSRVREFMGAVKGNVTIIAAVGAAPLLLAIGAAVDYSRISEASANLQASLDAAALGTLKSAATSTADKTRADALSMFNAGMRGARMQDVRFSSQYDSQAKSLTLSARGDVDTTFMRLAGLSSTSVGATSKAAMGGGQRLPVCVMVTDPDSGHTLLVKDNAKIDFFNCMVQVNTLNWDAVESRDTSYIHSTNGQNCFVGEIHYGDVQPPKSPTCTFFPDPFAGLTSLDKACDFTNKTVTIPGTSLTPGTYCNDLVITASTNFQPGLYIIRGNLSITGAATNINADQVTFVLKGAGASLFIETAGNVVVNANRTAAAAQFAGFAFFLDNYSPSTAKKTKGGKAYIGKTNMTASGIFYFAGQTLSIEDNARVTINPGTIVADFILPVNATLNLHGTLNTATSAEIALQKTSDTGMPVLVR